MSKRLTVHARREQLLELGLAVFSEQPYDAVSIDDIAARADMSKGLLYHYFGSKRGFYVQTLERAAERLLDAVTPPAEAPTEDRARRGLAAYLDFVAARAAAFTALMRGGLGADPQVEAVVDGVRNAMAQRVLDQVPLEPTPLLRASVRAWVGAVEAASLHWIAHPDVDRDALIDVLLAQLTATVTAAAR